MKTIGIIGGMSYESSIHYYERINRQVNQQVGGLNCAKLIIYNVNFEEIHELMLKNEWNKIGSILGEIAKKLEEAGADYIVIATNTIHKVADDIQKHINVPLIHISDCVAKKCKEANVTYLGLLIGVTLRFSQGKCIDSLSKEFKRENYSVNASSCEFLEFLLKIKVFKELYLDVRK